MKVGINCTQRYNHIFYSDSGRVSALCESYHISLRSTATKCRLKMRGSKVFYSTMVSKELVKCKTLNETCKSEMRVVINKDNNAKCMSIDSSNDNQTFQQNDVYKIAENLYAQYKKKIESKSTSPSLKDFFSLEEIIISLKK